MSYDFIFTDIAPVFFLIGLGVGPMAAIIALLTSNG